MPPEVPARRGFGSIETIAEVHLVQVELEDAVLRVFALDARRQDQLLQFAADRLLLREKTLTRQLLRDRAAALHDAPVPQVGQRRLDDPHEIEAGMIVEALILDREDGLDQIRRDVVEADRDPLLLVDRERELIVGVEHRGRLPHFADALNGFAVGQTALQIDEEPDARDDGKARGRGQGRPNTRDQAWMFPPRAIPLRPDLINPASPCRREIWCHLYDKPCNRCATGTSVAVLKKAEAFVRTAVRTMLAFVVLVVMVRALFSHAVLLEPYGTPPLRSIELPTTRSALTDGIVRAYDQSSTDD